MNGSGSAFVGFRFPSEVISVAVRWYLRYDGSSCLGAPSGAASISYSTLTTVRSAVEKVMSRMAVSGPVLRALWTTPAGMEIVSPSVISM
jgi:transposase-like protein